MRSRCCRCRLVAGVLVDDAIVEIENIVRHMRMGKSGFRAAMEAADEIGLAVVATSFTIIAVFLPVSFMGGVSGQFFKQFGLTVAAAVFISLLVARMITPVLAAYALNRDAIPHRDDGPIMSSLCQSPEMVRCQSLENHRIRYVVFCAVGWRRHAVAEGLRAAGGFFHLDFEYRTAAGRQARGHRPRVGGATAIIAQAAGSDRRRWNSSAPIPPMCATRTVFVSMVPRNQRKASAKEIEQRMMPLLNQVPDAHISFQNFGFGGGRDVTLFLVGDDPALTERTGHKLLDEMRGLKEIRSPRINGDLPQAGNRGASAAGSRRAIGRERAKHQRDHSHRDHGRSAAKRRQICLDRSHHSDPRQPAGEVAARSDHAREFAGAHELRAPACP